MFKKFFSAGLLFWIPLVVTVWILDSIIQFSDRLISVLPPGLIPEALSGVPGLGLVISASVVFFTGMVVANVLGRHLVAWWEALLDKIPVVRQIYSGIKKIASTFLSQQSQSFQKVVMVEYPRKGMWTLAFVVSEPDAKVRQVTGEDGPLLTVFVPTAPNPTSGYVVFVPEKDTRETSVSVDEAFTFHVSMGVVTPGAKSGKSQENS